MLRTKSPSVGFGGTTTPAHVRAGKRPGISGRCLAGSEAGVLPSEGRQAVPLVRRGLLHRLQIRGSQRAEPRSLPGPACVRQDGLTASPRAEEAGVGVEAWAGTDQAQAPQLRGQGVSASVPIPPARGPPSPSKTSPSFSEFFKKLHLNLMTNQIRFKNT